MQLGLYRTALAAARLSSIFKVSRLGKITNRGMTSRPDGNSVNSRNNLTDNERGQLQSSSSQVACEEESRSLSAGSMPKSKRRTRIDLGPLQLEASISISHQNDTYLPTSFGMKRLPSSRNPKLRQTYHEHGEAKRSSMFSLGTTIGEPFDICLPETRESNSLRSSVNEKNGGKSFPKVQSAEDNEQHKGNMENYDNIEDSVEETGQVLRPGMVLFKRYIPLSEQVDIVNRCRELGRGPGGFYQPGYDDGAKLRLYMMCLGLDWNPQTKQYGGIRQHDNVAPPDIPHEFTSLVSRVLDDSHTLIKRDLKTINVEDILPAMSPDVCIANFYTTDGRLGLHQVGCVSHSTALSPFFFSPFAESLF
ncbi:hypothetical protein Pfo_030398 [Paulownia fortunei]|nr:hypothetical protein Pfo_030398 [Paulownia fortunei]